jgi:hypothetical protein
MMREKDVVKADFSMLIIALKDLGWGGGVRILSEDSLPLNCGLNPEVS